VDYRAVPDVGHGILAVAPDTARGVIRTCIQSLPATVDRVATRAELREGSGAAAIL
jgi:hypothetical protein